MSQTSTPPSKVLARSEHRDFEVVAGLEALFWKSSGTDQWQHLPWWGIEQAFWRAEEEALHVAPVDDAAFTLAVSADSKVPEVVRERVMSSIVASVDLEVGAGVLVTFRMSNQGVIAQARWADPTQSQDPRWGAALAQSIRMAAANLGIDF